MKEGRGIWKSLALLGCSNLLEGVFKIWFYNFVKKRTKEKKKMILLWTKKTHTHKKESSATIMITVDGEGAASPVKLKLQGKSFE